MTLEVALAFVGTLLVLVLVTGPAILMVVGRSLISGFRSTISLISSILLGDLFYIALVFTGLAALSLLDAVTIMAIFVAVIGTVLATYAYAAGNAGALANDPRKIRLLNRCSGSLLVGVGTTVLLKRS